MQEIMNSLMKLFKIIWLAIYMYETGALTTFDFNVYLCRMRTCLRQ